MAEVVVAMTIMTICGGIFTGAVVTLSRTSNQAQAITNAATQNNQAYQTLDRTVRYASAISQPGVSTGTQPNGTPATGDWYVELRDTTSGSEMCSQLRVDITKQQVQTRRWKASDVLTTLTDWSPVTSGITNGGATARAEIPFALSDVAGTSARQQLAIVLISRSGPASQPVSLKSSFTLTAMNSTLPLPTTPICQQAGRP